MGSSAQSAPMPEKAGNAQPDTADTDGPRAEKIDAGLASAEDLARLSRARESDGLTPKERQDALSALGKEIARIEAGRVATRIIKESGLSLGEIQGRYGFDKATLSRLANGVSDNGPSLWLLQALGEALGYRVRLVPEKK